MLFYGTAVDAAYAGWNFVSMSYLLFLLQVYETYFFAEDEKKIMMEEIVGSDRSSRTFI